MKYLFLFLNLIAFNLSAQKTDTFRIDSLPTEGVLLDKGWKFHAGDNPDFAKPDFDDSAWTPIDPTKDIMALPEIFNAQIKWLRLDFEVENKLPNPLGIAINQAGASEIYLNGRLIHQFGHFDTDSTKIKAYDPLEIPIYFPADSVGQYHLAVRYVLQPNIRYTNIYSYTKNRLFNATILNLVPTLNVQSDFRVYYTGLDIFKIGIFFMLFVLHLAFYFYQRSNKTHLLLAMCFLTFALNFVFKIIGQSQFSVEYRYFNMNLAIWVNGFGSICMYNAFYRMAKVRLDIYYSILIVLQLVAMFVPSFTYGFPWEAVLILTVYIFSFFVMFRLTRMGLKKGIKGFLILGVAIMLTMLGLICLILAVLVLNYSISPIGEQVLKYGISPYLLAVVVNLGLIAVPVGLSLFMGIEGNETNKALSKQLVKNDQLKNEAIEHEQEKQQILATLNETLEKQVHERTAELEHNNQILKSTQTQLIEKEKMASLGALRLQELDAVKTRLYTNITHEFRTPLTVILGMAHQIMDKPKEYLTDGLKMIVRNGQSLLNLVNQMLDLSKLEAGKLSLHYQQGDVVNYVRYITESFHSLGEKKDVRLLFLTELEHLIMDYEEMRLQQIVSNLLSNAIKFTPKGGYIYVSVSTKNNALVLKIKDTGIGISETDLPFIFDRFYQVDEAHTHEGTGIGLALTHELVKLLEGTISVKSEFGKGTEFEVTLPIRNVSEIQKEAQKEIQQPISIDKSSNSIEEQNITIDHKDSFKEKPLVLIADDNADVRAYIASCLATDYRLIIAKDGQECENMAFDTTPDLIVLDVMMPFKSGFEVCKTLKQDERSSHIPIIMLTAKADMESKLNGLERGADAYLMKPFNKDELLLRIKKLLELRLKLQLYYRNFGLGISDVGYSEPKSPRVLGVNPTLSFSRNTEGGDKESKILAAEKEAILSNSFDNTFVLKVKTSIEAHLTDYDLDVEKLGRILTLSPSQVNRKLSALTGLTANSFIRTVRLMKSKEMLQQSGYNIAAIAYDCGFNDPAYFSRVFKQTFGVTPQVWREENPVA